MICSFRQISPISLKSASGISSIFTVLISKSSCKQPAGFLAINFICQHPISSTSEAGIIKSSLTNQEGFKRNAGKKSAKLGFFTSHSKITSPAHEPLAVGYDPGIVALSASISSF